MSHSCEETSVWGQSVNQGGSKARECDGVWGLKWRREEEWSGRGLRNWAAEIEVEMCLSS